VELSAAELRPYRGRCTAVRGRRHPLRRPPDADAGQRAL